MSNKDSKLSDIRQKNPGCVLVHISLRGDLKLKNSNLCVPKHFNVANFLNKLRVDQLKDIKPETALYLLSGDGMMVNGSILFGEMEKMTDDKGIIQLTLVKENIFG